MSVPLTEGAADAPDVDAIERLVDEPCTGTPSGSPPRATSRS
jgi:hypothetical protein